MRGRIGNRCRFLSVMYARRGSLMFIHDFRGDALTKGLVSFLRESGFNGARMGLLPFLSPSLSLLYIALSFSVTFVRLY